MAGCIVLVRSFHFLPWATYFNTSIGCRTPIQKDSGCNHMTVRALLPQLIRCTSLISLNLQCRTPGCSTYVDLPQIERDSLTFYFCSHFCYVCGVSIWDSKSPQSLSTMLTEHYKNCNQFDVETPRARPRIALGGPAGARRRDGRECVVQ